MAVNAIELLIQARDESAAAFAKAFSAIAALEAEARRAGNLPPIKPAVDPAALRNATVAAEAFIARLGMIAPAASASLLPLQSLATTLSAVAAAETAATIAGGAIFAIAGALGIGIARLGSELSSSAEQLARLSATAGVSAAELQVWQEVIKEAGGDAGELNQALFFFSRQMAEGNADVRRLVGDTKNVGEAFQIAAGKLSQMADVTERNRLMQAALGRASRQMAYDLKAIATESDGVRESMRQSGALMTDEVMKKAMALDASLDQLRRDWSDLWTAMRIAAVGPAMEIVGAIDAILKELRLIPRTSLELDIIDAKALQRQIQIAKAQIADLERQKAEIPVTLMFFSGTAKAKFEADLDAQIKAEQARLAGLIAANDEQQRQIARAMAAAGEKGGGSKPPGAGAPSSDLQKQADEIQRLLGVSAKEALAIASELSRAADAGSRIDLLGKISAARGEVDKLLLASETLATLDAKGFFIGPPLTKEMEKEVALLQRMQDIVAQMAAQEAGPGKVPTAGVAGQFRPELTPQEAPEPKLFPMDALLDRWRNDLAQMTSAADVWAGLMLGTFDSIQAGGARAFDALLFDAKNFGEAVKDVFRSIANVGISELTRFGTAELFKGLFGAFGVGEKQPGAEREKGAGADALKAASSIKALGDASDKAAGSHRTLDLIGGLLGITHRAAGVTATGLAVAEKSAAAAALQLASALRSAAVAAGGAGSSGGGTHWTLIPIPGVPVPIPLPLPFSTAPAGGAGLSAAPSDAVMSELRGIRTALAVIAGGRPHVTVNAIGPQGLIDQFRPGGDFYLAYQRMSEVGRQT